MSGRRIAFTKQAQKALSGIDATTRVRLRQKIRQLADDPASLANNVKRLKGEGGLYRLRAGDWRVIYSDSGIVLLVVRVAPRGSAYD